MSTEDGRGPRRGNGYLAASWVRLTDLDPVLAEHVLEVLATAAIPAYASPVQGSVGGYLEVRLPDRPTDRLYVDTERLEEARDLVRIALAEHEQAEGAQAGPDPVPEPPAAAATPGDAPAPALSDDDIWAGIVDGFDRGPEGPVAPWPASEDVTPDTSRLTTIADIQARMRFLRSRSDNPLDGPAEADEDGPAGVDPADQEGYVAPPPPPVPKAHPAFWGAISAIVAGLALIVAPTLVLGSPGSSGTFGTGIALVVGGAAVLVWRLQDGPPTDSGPEDGAVV